MGSGGGGGGSGGGSDQNGSGARQPGSTFESDVPGVAPLSALRLVPFPIVRIRGVIVRGGVSLQIVTVLAPGDAQVEVICTGRGCPRRRERRAPSGEPGPRVVRFGAFEHHFLPAGTQLRMKITKPGRLGKYTRFVIRDGRVPLRGDLCLFHGARVPIACPGG